MLRMMARPIAWLLLLALLYVTIAPIELRPTTGEPPSFERFAAFALVGFAFACGYPRQWWLVMLVVVGAACTFELAQLLVPSRHAHFEDAAVKAIGGMAGTVIGLMVNRLLTRLVPR